MKKIIKRICKKFGYDIIKYSSDTNPALKILHLLTTYNINVVFDVGANIGYYAKELFDMGYKGKIISFEPLSSAYDILLKNSKSNPNWEVAERCAIGNVDGKIKINISKNSLSSSILPMLESHILAEPGSVYIGSEEVNIFKLDTIAKKYINDTEEIFLKLDVQGYENNVLDGSLNLLTKIRGIQLEMSVVNLYEDQLLFEDMLNRMKEIGFSLYFLFPVFSDSNTGRMLQLDGFFLNSKIPDIY